MLLIKNLGSALNKKVKQALMEFVKLIFFLGITNLHNILLKIYIKSFVTI